VVKDGGVVPQALGLARAERMAGRCLSQGAFDFVPVDVDAVQAEAAPGGALVIVGGERERPVGGRDAVRAALERSAFSFEPAEALGPLGTTRGRGRGE
jgi:hypothetical protein